MATTFLDPGGDADFGLNLYASTSGSPTIATDFVHGTHVKSIRFPPAVTSRAQTPAGVLSDAGSRWSYYVRPVVFPTAASVTIAATVTAGSTSVFGLRMTPTGKLGIYDAAGTQLGLSSKVMALGRFQRICVAYTITSTTVNRFEVFVDGVSFLSLTNVTLTATVTSAFLIQVTSDTTIDLRVSDIYVDNSSSLTDTGDIWVTAKRPFANGTTNGFATQIGAGGSGYGSGHAPQVNERPLSTTNGWSMVGAGSAVTEEYTIEGAGVGDFNLSGGSLVDYMGWVYASAALAETGSIIVGGASSNIALTNVNTMFTKAAASITYPAGGTDIGIVTSTTVTTVSLYECGILVAFKVAPMDDSSPAMIGRQVPDDGVVSTW